MKILLAFIATWMFVGTTGLAAENDAAAGKSTESAKTLPSARMLKLDGTDVDLGRLEKESRQFPSSSLGSVQRREKNSSGNEIEVRYDRRAKYFQKNKHIAILESKILGDEVSQGYLKVYRDDGSKILETKVEPDGDGDYLNYEDVWVLGNHHVVTIASKSIGEDKRVLDIYDIDSGEVVFSTPAEHVRSLQVSPEENQVLLYLEKGGSGAAYRYDFLGKRLEKILDNGAVLAFSGSGNSYVLASWQQAGNNPVTGSNSGVSTFYFYRDNKLIWTNKTKPYEARAGEEYSKYNKYFIFSGQIDRKMKGNRVESYKKVFYIFDASDGRVVADGQLSPEIVQKYKDEDIRDRGNP